MEVDPVPQPTGKPRRGGDRKRVSADRFALLNGFVDFTLARLTRSEIAVWLILYRDSRNDVARTSQADLARRGGLSERGVRDAIQRLKAKGLLSVVRRGGLRQGPSSYRVHLGETLTTGSPLPADSKGQPEVLRP